MADNKKITWTSICERTEKDSGIPKSTIQEVMNGTSNCLQSILKEECPKLKDNDSLTLITPFSAIVAKNVPAHIEKDEKGKEYECSAAIGMTSTIPVSFLEIANESFSVGKKAINK